MNESNTKPRDKTPAVLKRKIFTAFIIGIGCFLCGLTYHLCFGDKTLLMLSGVLLVCFVGKAVDLLIVVKRKAYKIADTVCAEIKAEWLIRKSVTVRFTDTDNRNFYVKPEKHERFTVDSKYRIYYRVVNDNAVEVGSEAILGYESI